jgi:hypothetical protein
MKKLLFLVLTICLGAAMPLFAAGDGLCLYERFTGEGGGADSMLTEAGTPAYTEYLTSTRIDPAVDNYRARFTFWLTPTVTGDYQFRIAVDDDMRIWMSPDASPTNAVLIESRNGARGINDFSQGNQYSSWLYLEAGRTYWMRTGMREGGGGDHMNLQWQGPGFGWQNISGPAMTSVYPIDVEWGGERLVAYDVWTQTSDGFNAAPYTSLGYSNAAFPPLDLVLSTEGDPDTSGYVSTFTLAGTGAPADYFVTRERAIMKVDEAIAALSLGISTDDGGLLFAGDWWDTYPSAPLAELLLANNDGLHGMRWRLGTVADVVPGYYGIETWQYEHGGGEGLDVVYRMTGQRGFSRFCTPNLVSPVEVSLHSPVNGALDVPVDTVLSWEPRFGAEAGEEVKVYVWEQGAAKGAGELISETSYDPDLAMDKAYWWQVNTFEPNEVTGIPVEVAGKKLAFATVKSDVVITAQPQGAGVDLGGSATLSVEATSAVTPLSYQWKKDGADIGGADQATYAIPSMTRDDNGVYTCMVTNGDSSKSTESAGARVYLKELVAYWPLDGDMEDHAEDIDPAAIGDKDAVFAVNDPNILNPNDDPDATVPYVTGRVGSALDFNGQNNFAYAGTWNPTEASGRMTVEFWTRWDGDEGHWAGPIGKRDTYAGDNMMWQIEIDDGSDRLKTLQSAGGGGYATITLPSSGGTNVAAGAIISYSAQHPTNRDEAAWRAFDGRNDTKWLAFYNTAWLQATFADKKAYVVTSYEIVSANDADARDPDDWTLQGSNDGVTWDILDTKVGQAGVWTARNQAVSFALSNTTAYRMYRLDVTKIRTPSANIIQLSEVRLFAADALGANAWALITMVYDGAAATMYVNGLPIATQGMSLDGDTAASLVFGGCEANPDDGNVLHSKPWGGNLYGGAMDEVKIYNYPLSAVEVMQNYYAVADGDPICIAGTQPEMDQNGNCVVDIGDLLLLVNQWLLDNNTN